jgi:hypothetical protein
LLPISAETMGPLNQTGLDFNKELDRRKKAYRATLKRKRASLFHNYSGCFVEAVFLTAATVK